MAAAGVRAAVLVELVELVAEPVVPVEQAVVVEPRAELVAVAPGQD